MLCRKDATECIGMLAQCFPVAKGSTELGPDVDTTMAALLYSDETMVLMISNLAKLHFETRKAVVEIFQSFCKYQQPTSKEYPGLVYVRHRPYLMRMLVLGYDEPSIALNCGEMARFAISRDPDITNAVLKSEVLFSFFEHVQVFPQMDAA
jgi:calcium binding protein 39